MDQPARVISEYMQRISHIKTQEFFQALTQNNTNKCQTLKVPLQNINYPFFRPALRPGRNPRRAFFARPSGRGETLGELFPYVRGWVRPSVTLFVAFVLARVKAKVDKCGVAGQTWQNSLSFCCQSF